uniref:Serpin 6 n=1 Tax=Rhipicephalus haemaphysaloides TaxID=237073 RepID=A0A7L7SG95_RHIHE|nr:serpin 6 [Rhipicephalus haemaphysaloides]
MWNSNARALEAMEAAKATNPLGYSLLHFSVDLYKQLTRKSNPSGENVFYSPFSISAALSMALAGARNTTAKQLAEVLHVDSEEIHKHFSGFISQLPGYAPDVKLHVANRMYLEKAFPVLDSYLSILRDCYGSTIESVDFRNNSDNVRSRVNAWVEQATQSKIRDLLQPGSVDTLTTLILVNAIYFKGLWKSQFKTNCTRLTNFHLYSNSKTLVHMMYQKSDFNMAHNMALEATALEIPYEGGKTSMVVLLPDKIDGLSTLEEALSADKVTQTLMDLRNCTDVKLYLPRFKFEQAIYLKQTLAAMGIEELFSLASADLTGISAGGNLWATEVVHKAFIEVNEEGTEAAAATAVVMAFGCSASRVIEKKFVVDHPFMFLIRSRDPDIILFVGSVRRPQLTP